MFRYAASVGFARCNLRLRPIAWSGQTIVAHRITVDPDGSITPAPRRAGLVNVDRLVVPGSVRSLEIVSEAMVDVFRRYEGPRDGDPPIAEIARTARLTTDVSDTSPAQYLYPSPYIPADTAIASWASGMLDARRPAFEAALELAQTINREFVFDPDATKTETPPAQAFAARAGVCQDFTQIMISALRSAGIPAAYVSGYIRTLPPPGQPKLQGADATHGWVLVWCGDPATGGRGWTGLDPTNGIVMAQDHIVVAIGRDYLDIAPVDGVFTGSGAQSIHVAVDVEPVIVDVNSRVSS